MTYGPVSLTRLRDFRYLHSLNVALSQAMTTSNCIGRHSQAAWRSRTLQDATQIDPEGIAFGADLDQKRRTSRCLSASSSTCDPANMRGSSPCTLGATPIYQGDCLPDRMGVRVVGTENIHTYTPLRHLTKVTCYSFYCETPNRIVIAVHNVIESHNRHRRES